MAPHLTTAFRRTGWGSLPLRSPTPPPRDYESVSFETISRQVSFGSIRSYSSTRYGRCKAWFAKRVGRDLYGLYCKFALLGLPAVYAQRAASLLETPRPMPIEEEEPSGTGLPAILPMSVGDADTTIASIQVWKGSLLQEWTNLRSLSTLVTGYFDFKNHSSTRSF